VVYTHGPILEKEFIHSKKKKKKKKFKDNILSLKKIIKFNDSFIRTKIYTPNFNHEIFEKVFEKSI